MADEDLQEKVDSILSSKGEARPQAARAFGLTSDAGAPAKPRPLFSSFADDHIDRASELAAGFIKTAETKGLDAALQEISEALEREPVAGLVQYALQLFITHYPEARAKLKLKPLEVRQPDLVRSSDAAPELTSTPTAFAATKKTAKKKAAGGATPPENKISFWREDPLLNEHHEHWHLVYPTRLLTPPPGPKPEGGYALGDRHGELFAYMHEQMIARYDAERIAVGVDPVKPFDAAPLTDKKFTAKIPQGYDPGPLKLWTGNSWTEFRARPADAVISDLTLNDSAQPGGNNWATRVGAKISVQVGFGNSLFAANASGNYDLIGPDNPVTIDNLGNTAEANANSSDAYGTGNPKNFQTYGQFHNDGHIHFMIYDNVAPYGVMATTATAVRDPIFFRWHKLVDDIYYDYQQRRLTPYDFSGGPAVKVRKSTKASGATSKDIILCLEQGLPDAIAGNKFGSRAYNNLVTAAFSDTAKGWDKSFAKGTYKLPTGESITTTDVLKTEMRERQIKLDDGDGNPVTDTVTYLSHEDFYYFVRIENTEDKEQSVAVRIFLAPETKLADRRAWIEMDKFAYRLKPKERAVIFRAADESSVVRKPALKPDDLTADDGSSPAREAQPWCDCGWPYTLLLPRGTKPGMKFRLLVMCSKGEDLTIPDHPECCTSISYCGLQDLDYPDKTGMGFPFDRKFKSSIKDTVEKNDNWAWRTIKIRCKNP